MKTLLETATAGQNEEDKKMNSQKNVIERSKEYREPVVVWGKSEVKVSFYAFDPESGVLKRKLIRLNRELSHIEGKRAKREYAEGVAARIREELRLGWNPWMQQSESLVYVRWEDACDRYREWLTKQLGEENMREDTVASYMSYHRVLMRWVATERKNVRYAYQMDHRLVDSFLDYVYLDLGNSLQTRNNYLAWLKVFSKWMLQKSYIEQDPTAGIKLAKKRQKGKGRSVIPDSVLADIHEWLEVRNRYFLLACHVLHYMFVRPKEMSYLKVGDFSVKRKTLLLHGDHTKNGEDAVVTVPDHVMRLMVELGVLEKPGDWYLFSDGFKPGAIRRDEKQFRDYWNHHVRKGLNLPSQYKFYSLKDTGITNMLRANTDVLTVRDQARHSSILITDIYTPKDIQAANELIVRYRGVL